MEVETRCPEVSTTPSARVYSGIWQHPLLEVRSVLEAAERTVNSMRRERVVSCIGFWGVSGPGLPLVLAGASKAARIPGLLWRNQVCSEMDPV